MILRQPVTRQLDRNLNFSEADLWGIKSTSTNSRLLAPFGRKLRVPFPPGYLPDNCAAGGCDSTGSKPIALFKLSYGTARVLCAGAIVFTLRLSSVMFRYRSIPYSGVRAGSIGLSPGGGL